MVYLGCGTYIESHTHQKQQGYASATRPLWQGKQGEGWGTLPTATKAMPTGFGAEKIATQNAQVWTGPKTRNENQPICIHSDFFKTKRATGKQRGGEAATHTQVAPQVIPQGCGLLHWFFVKFYLFIHCKHSTWEERVRVWTHRAHWIHQRRCLCQRRRNRPVVNPCVIMLWRNPLRRNANNCVGESTRWKQSPSVIHAMGLTLPSHNTIEFPRISQTNFFPRNGKGSYSNFQSFLTREHCFQASFWIFNPDTQSHSMESQRLRSHETKSIFSCFLFEFILCTEHIFATPTVKHEMRIWLQMPTKLSFVNMRINFNHVSAKQPKKLRYFQGFLKMDKCWVYSAKCRPKEQNLVQF